MTVSGLDLVGTLLVVQARDLLSVRRRAPRRAAALIAVALSMVALTACDTRRFVSGWLPYWSIDSSSQTFLADSNGFEEMSPFQFEAKGQPDNIVSIGRIDAFDAVIAAAREQGIPVLPSIVDHFPPRGMAAVLADPETRHQHVDAIVDLVMSRGYDGIDLDYERFAFYDGVSTWATTKPNWVAFVTELGAELHARKKLLSVTTPALWIDQWGNERYWVYAWKEIAPAIDRLRIMAYDWSYGQPGPMGPIYWVRQTLAYAADTVPMSKVQLGIPGHGREWTTKTEGNCPADALPAARKDWRIRLIPNLISEVGATPRRDAASNEMTFTYEMVVKVPPASTTTTASSSSTSTTSTAPGPADRCIITREVWYQDGTSWRTAATTALEAGASGVAIWALGYETTEARDALADLAALGPAAKATAPQGRITRLRVGDDGRLRVRGWAFDPETDLPITVTASLTSLDDPARRVTVRSKLARQAQPALLDVHPEGSQFHGVGFRMKPVSGDYRLCLTATGRYAGPADTRIGCRKVTVP